jgi:hypothetical protein
MKILNNLKIRFFAHILKEIDSKIISDLFINYSKKEFGEYWKKGVEQLRTKLAQVVFEMGQMIR